MLQRVEVGDPQAVGDEASRRAAPARADHDPMLPGELVEVPDDKEVRGVARLADDRQLVVRTLLDGGGRLFEAPAHPVFHQLSQVLVRAQAVGNIERREQRGAQVELEVDHVGDVDRAGEGVRKVGERGPHLLRRL